MATTAMSLTLAILAGLVLIYGYLLQLVNNIVPRSYMDEIFHVPQAQLYCKGQYLIWDPMITTPPGLYLLSNILFSALNYLNNIGLKISCSTSFLRATNSLLGLGVYLVLFGLLHHLRPQQSATKNTVTALIISFFPVGFFYNFLYYTDTGSTFFVLLSYLLSLKKRNYIAALCSFVSIWFRQTNVIWNCFILGNAVFTELLEISENRKKGSAIGLRLSQLKHVGQLVQLIDQTVREILNNWKRVFLVALPYCINVILFVGFLKWNGGIVLGDKSNHIAGLHFPQIFYFISFTSAFLAPYLVTSNNIGIIHSYVSSISFKALSQLAVLLGCMNILIYKFTFEHPFLLSDNRHYSFYVWKKIYKLHSLVKYLLSPIYVIAGRLLCEIVRGLPVYWCLLYMITILLVLVPSPLLEFRYFILPFLMIRIHSSSEYESNLRLSWEFFVYLSINLFTLYMFLYRPFTWDNVDELQRFMW